MSKKSILEALVLALTAGIIVVKAAYEMDDVPMISREPE